MGARTTASQPLLESRPPLYMKDDIGSCSPGACQTSEMFLIAINKLVQGMGVLLLQVDAYKTNQSAEFRFGSA